MNKEASTMAWYELGSIKDIPLRGSRTVDLGEQRIGVFRTATDKIYALEDKCPHKGGPLSQGIVHDNCVTCPLHNFVISLESGEAQGADDGSVKTYPIKVVDELVHIGLATTVKVEVV